MKLTKISGHLLLWESSDPSACGTSLRLKHGNWKVSDAVKEAESNLELKRIIDYHQSNRVGSDQSQPLKYSQTTLSLEKIDFINFPGNWRTEISDKSWLSDTSGPMDKMVQLFGIRLLFENNASYTQVFTVILLRCHLWHSDIFLKSKQMVHLFKTILLSMQ